MRLLTQAFSLICAVQAVQIPIRPPSEGPDPENRHGVVGTHESDPWDLLTLLDADLTGRFVFDVVGSLLQHWPNTRYRNGHSIVPGTVPLGTLLYHGRTDSSLPTVPDWTATDPEHSYLFCEPACWHFTLVATRSLKVLYFDGSSAAKMQGGPMDSQDILLWGKVKPDWTFNERKRLDDLCSWGGKFGLDGFARMEMDFEIMLCNFTAGVDIVSSLNLVPASDGHPSRGPPPDNFTGNNYPLKPNAPPHSFEVIHSGSWHNFHPGETRIQLDFSRFLTFYDTSLAPSLIAQRQGKERWEHRLEGIDEADVDVIMRRLSEVLTSDAPGSKIDWTTLVRVIMDRYGDRLEFLEYILDPSNSETLGNEADRATKAQRQLRVMLTPYILASAVPPNSTTVNSSKSNATGHSWASPIYRNCATTHTSYISSISDSLTTSEKLLLNAVQETNREICRVVVGMWSAGILAGIEQSIVRDQGKVTELLEYWRVNLESLMKWLDWSVWVRCKPACSPEEICYLPTWPYFYRGFPQRPPQPRPSPGPGDETYRIEHHLERADVPEGDEKDWENPQPKCIRRIEPYSF